MADEAQGKPPIAPLRESLRRLDAVLTFARKLARDSDTAPPGLVDDFREACKAVEKEFVLAFQALDPDLQARLRALVKSTRRLTGRQITANAPKLSHHVRSALNRLVIGSNDELSLTQELDEVRYGDGDLDREPPEPPSPALAPRPTRPAQPAVKSRRPLIAVGLVLILAAAALGVGYLAWPWSKAPQNADEVAADDEGPDADANEGGDSTDDEAPFDARAHGYVSELSPRDLSRSLRPLETPPDNLNPGELVPLLMGLEEEIDLIEPDRLRFGPAETRRRLREFAVGATEAAPGWIEDREPLLDAFVAQVREEARLDLYPPSSAGNKVLLSDVLYSLGGGRRSMVVTVGAMARACGAPLTLIAPHGPSRPLVGIRLDDGWHTFNGQGFGLRSGEQPVLLLRELMTETAASLRPTMGTARGRLYCDALFRHFGGEFDAEYARKVLADLAAHLLIPPGDEADPARKLTHRVAVRLQPFVCEALLVPEAGGDADEALALFELARAAQDTDRAERALLILGERAEGGAMLEGEPLALVVGDLLREQGEHGSAAVWYWRAMEEFPEDPRPVLRLLAGPEVDDRLALMREAYARGERELEFLQGFAEEAAGQGEGLVALAIRDEVLTRDDFTARDIELAALQCLALQRKDWALRRLRDNAQWTDGDSVLERLELICELSANGLSIRAEQLAARWRERGEDDPFVADLLRRHGG